MDKCLCIIPLRSNSKRLKNKNIKKINGIPLCIYSINEALKSKIFYRIIIASDKKSYFSLIKQYFKKNNKKLEKLEFFLRSKKSSTSNARTEIVIQEILKKNRNNPIVFLIQASSPLLSSKDIIKSKKLISKHRYDSIFSSFKNKQFIWQNKSTLKPLNYNFKNRPMKQNFTNRVFVENGAIYAFKARGFMKHKNRLFNKIGTIVMPEDRSLDIDDLEDFLKAKRVIEDKNS